MRRSVGAFSLLVSALWGALAACSSQTTGVIKPTSHSAAAGSGMPLSAADSGVENRSSFIVSTKPASASPTPTTCASTELEPTRVTPTVWLMIDGSGSMGAPLDADLTGPTRWTLLRDALMAADGGLVPRLQAAVKFGLYVYDGGLSLPGVAGPQCPRTVIAEPALDNAAAMDSSYPMQETGASTPTHYALLDLKARIDAAGPDPAGPTFIVLATDGKPNLCDFHDGLPATPDTEQEAVQTVQQLSAAGTRLFVISLAGDDEDLQKHLQDVAAAGGSGTAPFTPKSQTELAAALTQIIAATASCDVRLQGRVESGSDCSGSVMLDGVAVPCNARDGYRVKDDRQSLELLGGACTSFQTAHAPELKVTFPCANVTLL